VGAGLSADISTTHFKLPNMKKDPKMMITKDGPYLVSGGLPIDKQIIGIGKEAEPEKWIRSKRIPSNESCALCRCGQSENKPFCDGSHIDSGFNDGDESPK
jgi:CDGSH-type Zn-finger protein